MLSVIIPTINEEGNLKTILPTLKQYCDEIVIVDDGSTDGTLELARQHACKIVNRGKKLGVGSAVYDGVRAASHAIVAIMDADHSHPMEALKSAVLIEVGSVDIIKFSRFVAGGGMEDNFRHGLMRLFNRFLAMIAHVHTQDFTGGYIVATKECFDFEQTAIQGEWNLEFMIHNRKKRIAEIPYIYKHRASGQSNWTGRQDVKRVFRYVYYLFHYRWKALRGGL